MFTTQAEYAANFNLTEREMVKLASDVRTAADSANFTSTGLFAATADAKSAAIFAVRRVLDAITALAAADRAAAEDVLDGPEPPQTAETLAALQYQQALLLRQYPAGDTNVVNALADAVDDGDAVKAQVLSDMAEGLRWSIDSIDRMAQFEELRKQAIALRADPERRAALDQLDLLDGTKETAGVDGKVQAIGYAVGQRADAILRFGGEDQMTGSFRLDWVTPAAFLAGQPCDYAGTVRLLGVIPPITR